MILLTKKESGETMILFKLVLKDLHNLTQIRFLVLAHPFSPTQCLVLAKVLKKQHTKY